MVTLAELQRAAHGRAAGDAHLHGLRQAARSNLLCEGAGVLLLFVLVRPAGNAPPQNVAVAANRRGTHRTAGKEAASHLDTKNLRGNPNIFSWTSEARRTASATTSDTTIGTIPMTKPLGGDMSLQGAASSGPRPPRGGSFGECRRSLPDDAAANRLRPWL